MNQTNCASNVYKYRLDFSLYGNHLLCSDSTSKRKWKKLLLV